MKLPSRRCVPGPHFLLYLSDASAPVHIRLPIRSLFVCRARYCLGDTNDLSLLLYQSISSGARISGLKRFGKGPDGLGMTVIFPLPPQVRDTADRSVFTSPPWIIPYIFTSAHNSSQVSPCVDWYFLSDNFDCADWLLYVVRQYSGFRLPSCNS
jgi:hypothetical protein